MYISDGIIDSWQPSSLLQYISTPKINAFFINWKISYVFVHTQSSIKNNFYLAKGTMIPTVIKRPVGHITRLGNTVKYWYYFDLNYLKYNFKMYIYY